MSSGERAGDVCQFSQVLNIKSRVDLARKMQKQRPCIIQPAPTTSCLRRPLSWDMPPVCLAAHSIPKQYSCPHAPQSEHEAEEVGVSRSFGRGQKRTYSTYGGVATRYRDHSQFETVPNSVSMGFSQTHPTRGAARATKMTVRSWCERTSAMEKAASNAMNFPSVVCV